MIPLALGTVGASLALADEPAPMPLSTSGRYVIDAAGKRFKLASVNWYGGSDRDLVVGGLDRAPLASIVASIKAMGFNSVRLPFSNIMLHAASVDPAKLQANPQLLGLRPLEVYDAVVSALTDAGLVVILNNHTTNPIWCCNYEEDGLWYTKDYGENAWVADWEMLAERYRGNPRVAGVDLRNEIRIAKWRGTILPAFPNWGSQPNDWRAAAERAGQAVHRVNPNLLVVVEGLNAPRYHLRGVPDAPIRLEVPGKLVYAAHNYSFTGPEISGGPSYGSMSWPDYSQLMYEEWAFVLEPNHAYTAPVWLSEFGAHRRGGEGDYWDKVIRYLQETDADWAVWALNPGPKPSGDPEDYGWLEDDWVTPVTDYRRPGLTSIIAPRHGPGIDDAWGRVPENQLTVLPLAAGDSDRRRERFDWAPYSYKATCAEGSRLVGISRDGGTRSSTHAVLCSSYALPLGQATGFGIGNDNGDSPWAGAHTEGRDWAPYENKLECPRDALVVGYAQQWDTWRSRHSALLCQPGLDANRPQECHAVTVGESDNRRSELGGDWDNGYAKSQCADDEFVAGISLHKGHPWHLLCCALR